MSLEREKEIHKRRKDHKNKINKPHLKRVNNYFERTGFYRFVYSALKKALPTIIIAVVVLFVFNHFYNIKDGLLLMTQTFSTGGVLFFFYLSETFLGLIPPEIFLGWASMMDDAYLYIAILATLSYLGGLTAYFFGVASLKITAVRDFLQVKMAKNLKNTQKWGGILIVVGALLPLPFAISCLTAGMIKYPFKNVMLYGLFRFIRFAIYGYLTFSAFN